MSQVLRRWVTMSKWGAQNKVIHRGDSLIRNAINYNKRCMRGEERGKLAKMRPIFHFFGLFKIGNGYKEGQLSQKLPILPQIFALLLTYREGGGRQKSRIPPPPPLVLNTSMVTVVWRYLSIPGYFDFSVWGMVLILDGCSDIATLKSGSK